LIATLIDPSTEAKNKASGTELGGKVTTTGVRPESKGLVTWAHTERTPIVFPELELFLGLKRKK
jgi:hypothetical protein